MLASGCSKNYTSENICNEFISAVVEIQIRDSDEKVVGNATGTIIDKNGMILTNRHVIRSYSYSLNDFVYFDNFYIRRYNEEEYTKVRLVKYSNNSDLALLKTDVKIEKYFNLAKDHLLQYGEVIHTIGNGNGYGLAYAQGNVAAPLRNIKYDGEIIEAIQLSLTINEGNSGGPLINKKGELVGITTFRLRDQQNDVVQGTSFALPIKAINDFLIG